MRTAIGILLILWLILGINILANAPENKDLVSGILNLF